MAPSRFDEHAGVFVISVAAELTGMHPQTLRTYDRLGIVSPQRTSGRGRRYSAWNIAQLRQVQALSQEEGINLAGIKRIFELQNEVERLRAQLDELTEERDAQRKRDTRIFATSQTGEVEAMRRGQRPRRRQAGALVVWRPDGSR
ncbi:MULTISPECIES: heat shock protein transcriptional repressor HspR [Dermabacter]|uniref:heat shock protein transcriptional repressor HspR n=1 Tax=Dermabacter TaxID=36739 RepID=UPI0008A35450|nr:helix-turn-helix transcriptional regulator [Dermabacter sp. HMSC08H10]MDU2597114.1 helix-turn-helix transcriptional regulator [Dermabacter sp.]MDU5962080.1 helix-turn-helix transcriptional regulator [Dermabacter sp.]OFT19844.1 transcriptional regulator [Dermabacter sp. HMSC08H10]WIK61178.1 helix-turn-helix transcriptional regulator [Dermabacter hominis]